VCASVKVICLQKLNEWSRDKSKTKIALLAQSSKYKKGKGKWNANRWRGNYHNPFGKNIQKDQGSTSNNQRTDGSGNFHG